MENVVEQSGVEDNESGLNSLSDLIDCELEIEADIAEGMEIVRNAYQNLSDEAQEVLTKRAREVIGVVNPELAKEIEDGEIFIGNRQMGRLEFVVCMGEEEGPDGNHQHETVAVIPDAALVLEDADWTKFLGMAKFLDESGLLIMIVNDHCGNCGALLEEDEDAEDTDEQVQE